MKRKTMLIGGMSLALVACISVGATLAYLTDKTGDVTNTVKFTTNGIELTLTETSNSPEADVEPGEIVYEDDGINYTDVVPGADLNKEPVLTVGANNVDCYVYALVTGVDEDENKALYTEWNKDWQKVDTASLEIADNKQFPENSTLLRYKAVVASKAIENTELTEIFDTVTINDALVYDTQSKSWMLGEEKVTLPEIVINGYAIQANNLVDGEDVDGTQAIAVADKEAANAFAVAKG